MNQIKELENKIEDLTDDMRKRKSKWKKFRSYLTHSTSIKFDEMLGLNKYSGDLVFDHENNALDLAV